MPSQFRRVGSNFLFFFFNDTATTEIYTLSLHDALPPSSMRCAPILASTSRCSITRSTPSTQGRTRSEEHTSELQSQFHLVCRLLLEKKNVYCPIVLAELEKNRL